MGRPPNRLARETSPYLLQHAHNPVEWYPWGPEALEVARREDKPILLSIGYAACHWCHVMERESFEDEEIARLMNRHFVCIKVDREERPELDEIYMAAVQAMTGHGGWPLTVFLTPGLKPFYGGTYFPPEDRLGMPGFATVLRSVARAYRERRDRIEALAEDLTRHLNEAGRTARSLEVLGPEPIRDAVAQLRRRFDAAYGGFSPAPKFPQPTTISLLLRYARRHRDPEALRLATVTLDWMAAGGIRDHIGGGFHRYSTDERWLVPHFEKMLYDNALLACAYLEAYQATGDSRYGRVAAQTLDWALREMVSEEGGYCASIDADSEGEEGRFYVWSRAEVEGLLGDRADAFCAAYDISEEGNWEGRNIPNRRRALREVAAELGAEPGEFVGTLEECRRVLLEARERRPRPGLDDKVLTDWNGLMIAAMARGYRVLGEPRYLESARRAARFLLATMLPGGRLLHAYRAGRARLLGYLDDAANLVAALVELYESTFEVGWLRQARRLADQMIDLFWDEEGGGFYSTGSDHEALIARPKPGHDGATPAGNAVAATVLLRLATLTGEDGYRRRAAQTLRAFQAQLQRHPTAFPQMLIALDRYLGRAQEVVVVGAASDPATGEALSRLWRQHAPDRVVALLDPEAPGREEAEREVPLLQGKAAAGSSPTFYLCENYACRAPTTDLEEILVAAGPALTPPP